MKLIKHGINEKPPIAKNLLILIDVGGNCSYLWTVGMWDGRNWRCSFDNVGYKVREWYELPSRKREKEFYQMTLKDFGIF